jgi:hypothetical protein
MNNDFIPYLEASLLKKLGYNNPSFGYFTENERLCRFGGAEVSVDFTYGTLDGLYKTYCLAPTYDQALTFFEEIYGLYIVFTQYYNEKFFYKIEDMQFPRRYDLYPVENLRNFNEYSKKIDCKIGAIQQLINLNKK